MSRRLSTLRDIGMGDSRDVDSKYDTIKLVADSLDIILAVESGLTASLKYLGANDERPTTRIDGAPIEDGDYYLDTSSGSKTITYYSMGDETWFAVDPEALRVYAENSAAAAALASTKADEAVVSAENAASSAVTAANSEAVAVQAAINAETYRTEALNASLAAAASEESAELDAAATAEDRLATAADKVATNADVVSSAASATASANHLSSIQAIYDTFDDRYLGAFAEDPTVDNDGDPLKIGAIYFNTTLNHTKFYNGVSWENPELASTEAAQATAADRVQTTLDREATAADRVATAADRIATAADAVATSADRISATASASSAATSEGIATTKAGEASTSATEALASKNLAEQAATAAGLSESSASEDATKSAQSAEDAQASADSVMLLGHALTKAEFLALAKKRKSDNAGSGFLEWGHSSGGFAPTRFDVNQGITCADGDSWADEIVLGYTGNTVNGDIEPTICVDGVTIKLAHTNISSGYSDEGSKVNSVILPDAPDGLDKLDGTGRFSDISAAVAAGTTDLDASVLSRKDFIMVEIFHEKISEKDWYCPLGNTHFGAVQYNGITGLVNNYIAQGYSAFGDWDTTTKGYGKRWSLMTDAEKIAAVQNPEDNIYSDNSELIQVRYRIRVLKGLGDEWGEVGTFGTAAMKMDDSNFIKPQGTKSTNEGFTSTGALYYQNENSDVKKLVGTSKGAVLATDGNLQHNLSYNGLCFAIPIALVQRRNKGAGHPFNVEGCKEVNDGSGGFGKWFNLPTRIVNLSHCFTDGYYRQDSGSIADTSANNGRWNFDNEFYDSIYVSDVADLRIYARTVEDSKLLFNETSKAISGKVIGYESVPFTFAGGINTYPTQVSATLGVSGMLSAGVEVGDTVTTITSDGSAVSKVLSVTNTYIILEDNVSRLSGGSFMVNRYENLSASAEPTWTGIIGTPANITAVITNLGVDGIYGTWIPNIDVDTSNRNLTRKTKDTVTIRGVYTTNNGGGWAESTWSHSTTRNDVYVAFGGSDVIFLHYKTQAHFTEDSINRKIDLFGNVFATNWNSVDYGGGLVSTLVDKVSTNTNQAKVNVSMPLTSLGTLHPNGNIDAAAYAYPEHDTINLVGDGPACKVLFSLCEVDGFKSIQMHYKEMVVSSNSNAHNDFTPISESTTTKSAGDKLFVNEGQFSGYWEWLVTTSSKLSEVYWVEVNGNLLASGLVYAKRWDGDGWGDDNKFQITDNKSYLADDNGNIVQYGTAVFVTNVLMEP